MQTIDILFLVVSGLNLPILVGCKIFRQLQAIINFRNETLAIRNENATETVIPFNQAKRVGEKSSFTPDIGQDEFFVEYVQTAKSETNNSAGSLPPQLTNPTVNDLSTPHTFYSRKIRSTKCRRTRVHCIVNFYDFQNTFILRLQTECKIM